MTTTQPPHFLIFDVSKFQNAPIPAADITAHGCPALMIRITQGHTEVDYLVDQHLEQARLAGVVPIMYHALLPGDEEAQAQFYVAQLVHRGLTPGVAGYVVDWEISGGDVIKFKDAFHAALEGAKLGVYASPSYYNDRLGGTEFAFDFAHVAQWVGDPRTGDPEHVLTSGGSDGNGVTPSWWTPFAGCEKYLMRQFSSSCDSGTISPIDVSVTYESLENFHSALGVGAPAAPPVNPAPVPVETGFDVNPPEVKQGSTGQAVQLAQGALLSHGFGPHGLCNTSGLPDGIFGPGTLAIVEAYQGQFGLARDGVIGPITWRDLLTRGL